MSGISGGFIIARLIASVMLLLALLRLPYDYYVVLRWVVCGTASYSVFKSAELKKSGLVWIFVIIALLFNPIIPIHLSRETWAPIDVIVALIFVISIFILRRKNYHDKK